MGIAFHLGALAVSLAFVWLIFSEVDAEPATPSLDYAFDDDYLEEQRQITADWDCTAGDGLD